LLSDTSQPRIVTCCAGVSLAPRHRAWVGLNAHHNHFLENTMTTTLRRTLLASALSGSVAALVTLSGCGMMSSSDKSSSMAMPAGDSTRFSATLSSAAEVPPNSSAGTGTLDATLNKSTNVLKWTVTYSGLSGPATMAHFHGPAMPGSNAGVVVPFASAASPIQGESTLNALQIADLTAGKWYANVHTAANPGGEIRGQVMMK
jgi:hypothetical protein